MLADPQTVTVNSVAKVMPKVVAGSYSSKYKLADESFALDISHETSKKKTNPVLGLRIRSMAKITQRALVTSPLDSTQSDYDFLSLHCVLDRPEYGFTQAQVEQLVTGFQTWLNTTMVGKLFGGES